MFDEEQSFPIDVPEWTTVSASIDLAGAAKLTLTPDRTAAVKDERHRAISNKLHDALATRMRKHLQDKKIESPSTKQFKEYVDTLLDDGVLKAGGYIGFELRDEVREMALESVYAEIISSDGTICFRSIGDLTSEETLAVTSRSDWPDGTSHKTVRRAADELLPRGTQILIRPARGSYSFNNFLNYLFGEIVAHALTDVPGLVLDVISNGYEHLYRPGFEIGRMPKLISSKGQPVLFHPASPCLVQHISFNSEHPLLSFLFKDFEPVSDLAAKLLEKLDEQLSFFIASHLVRPSLMRRTNYGSYETMEHEEAGPLFIEFLHHHPEFFDQVSDCFAYLWGRAKSAGYVVQDFPGLTISDLPWFWSKGLSKRSKSRSGQVKSGKSHGTRVRRPQ